MMRVVRKENAMKCARILPVCLIAGLMAFCASAAPNQATIYRDTWGVPHIYADTFPDAAYALGYAQAEDRLEDIYKNVRTATGTMAEAFGEEHAEIDYVIRLVRNAEVCEEYWKTAPASIREPADNFMRGVQAYVDEHPEKAMRGHRAHDDLSMAARRAR
jgi:acyl-homoserine lactone acylase PvdQ